MGILGVVVVAVGGRLEPTAVNSPVRGNNRPLMEPRKTRW
jgi:hypothetical protein